MSSNERRKHGFTTPDQNAGQQDPTTEAMAQLVPGGQDVLKVLSEFETGLDALRKLYAERQALQNRLREREDEIHARDGQLADKSRELSELRARFDEQVHQLDQARQELEDRERSLATRAEQIDHAMRAHAEAQRQSEEATAAALAEIDSQRAVARRDAEKLSERARELDKRAKELAEQGEALDRAQKELAKARAALQQEREQLDAMRRASDEREKQLAQREKQLEEQQAATQKQIATREKRIADLQSTIAEREKGMEESRTQLSACQSQLEQAHGQVSEAQQRCAAMETELQEAKANAQQAGELRGRVGQLEVALKNEQDHAQSLHGQCQQAAGAVSQLQQRCQEMEAGVERLRRELDEAVSARDAAHAKAASIAQELAARFEQEMDQALSRNRDELRGEFEQAKEQQRVAFADERRQFERRSSERLSQAIAEASSASAAALEKRLREEMAEELAREIEGAKAAALAESNQRLATEQKKWEIAAQQRMQQVMDAACEKTRQDLASKLESQHAENLASQLALHAGQASMSLEAARREARQQFERELHDVREQARQAIAQERERLEAETKARIERTIEEARTSASQGEAAVVEWQRKLEEERSQRGAIVRELTGVVEEYEQLWGVEHEQAARLSESIASLAGATDAQAGLSALRERIREDASQRNEMKEQLEVTTHQLSDAMSRIVALETRLRARNEDGAYIPGGWRNPESMERKRVRLQHARSLMRDQTDKIRKGSEALRKRFEQTERVLSQRAELAQARERVIDAERRVQSAAAKSKVGVVLLCVTTSIAILAGLSYGIAREVAPATFVATSVISADGRGRDLNGAELAEWKEYHENILKDPRFHQMAGERFQRVGFAELASASAAKQLAEQQIDVQERTPGEMMLSLSGEGSSRTERVLDTFTAAFVSHANAAQTARVDGSVTAVKQQAKSGTDPIDKTRMYWALGMLGGGVLLFGMIAMGIWRKLAGAKTQFERDTQMAAVLDQARWGDVSMPDLKDIEKRTVKKDEAQKKAA
jgi:hypothetical protein